MPTYTSMLLPPPTSGDDFEKVALSALRIKWRSPNLVRHGRTGQAQQGVDIYGPDDLGHLVGVQCKLTASDIADDPESLILQAEAFQPPISPSSSRPQAQQMRSSNRQFVSFQRLGLARTDSL